MGVEITGPRAYEYQYTVTVWMTLRFLDKEEEKVFVENKGFEDAFLTYLSEENEYFIDIQVKERSENITLEEFCEWLAHFEKRKTDTFLLKQVQQTNHKVVFITNNRCTDKVSIFLKESGNRKKLKKEELSEIKENILSSLDDKSGIGKIRYHVLNDFLHNIADSDFRKILNNVCLIENVSSEVVEEKIFKILKENYYVPQVVCKDVLNQMLEVVRVGRDTGKDIVPDIKQIIKAKSMQRILPEDSKYCVRELMETLTRKLEEEQILLLTGVPFSGKTYLAKAIAQVQLEQGYLIKRAESLVKDDEAYNFLWSKENDSRLLLLEDPFGHLCMCEDSLQEWDQLNRLISECVSKNRKIIVTSRNDILLEVCRGSDIGECSIRSHAWNNVDMNSIDEAKIVWEKYYGESEQSQEIFDRLKNFFEQQNMKTFLEIGEIAHLYTSSPEILKLLEMDDEQIVQGASLSAEEICRKIDAYGAEHKKIFMLLGGLCTTIKTISIRDFAYILYGENLKLSIRSNKEHVTVTIGGTDESDEEIQNFPIYDNQYALKQQERDIIREFCDKGYIYRDKVAKELSFKHPLYHYASIVLLKKELEDDWENETWVEYFNKAIGSLARNAALCALDMLMKYFDLNQQVLECFVDGSNSIFPAVRDSAVSFLDKHFDDLDEKMQREFISNIGRNKVAEQYLNWSGDECWYQLSNSFHRGFAMLWEELRRDSKNLEIIEQKISRGEHISKRETYQILHSNDASKLPLEFLEDAFLKEEVIIRSKAIYYIFSVYGENVNDYQEKYLKQFENYAVIYEILRGSLINWENLSSERKRIIIDYIKKQLERKSVAIAVKEFMEEFGDEYNYNFRLWKDCSVEERKKLWKVWAELFAQWLKFFPAKYISAHQSHIVYTAWQSLEYLKNETEIIVVAQAWIDWLKDYMKYHDADDYGMSVMSYLLMGTADTAALREGMIEQIMQEKDTNIITSHFSNIITNWEVLCDDEKESVCNFLAKKERKDYKWIQAVCLVQKHVPEEVQIAICGRKFLEEESKEILEVLLEEEILEECLSVYCGFPQPLWWNGYHHKASYFKWDGVITELLKKETFSQSYYIALREFIEALYNQETCRFIDGYCLYKQILQNKEIRKNIFDRLAYCVTINQDCKKMWDDLLMSSTEEEKREYFNVINDMIELFEIKHMRYGGLLKEFGLEDIKKYVLPNFPDDQFIIRLCECIMNLCKNKWFVKTINISYENGNSIEADVEKETEIKRKLKEVIATIYKESNVHLLFTGEVVKLITRELNIEFPELDSILEQHKDQYWTRYDKVKKEFEEKCPLSINDSYPLRNWCHTEKE